MDIDALSAARRARWARLAELSKGRTIRGAEADEMTRLFQQTAGDLAAVQSSAPEPGLVSRLSILLASARIWMTGAHTPSLNDLTRIVTRELPAALYRARWWAVGVAAGFLVIAVVTAIHTLGSPGAIDLLGTAQERAEYARQEFANYYSEYDGGSFAARVWTHNWTIAAIVIGAGISGIFPVVFVYQNAVYVGMVAAIMAEHGMLDLFLQLLAPHGLLELSAVLVSAAVGLRLFWIMLVPGARTRGRALAEEGRAAITVALALMGVLLISGLIEAFVTPSSLPWAVKDAFGVVVATAFWLYIFVVGRAATVHRATGDIEGAFSTATVLAAT